MSRTKGDLISGAYSKLRISGITVTPTAEDNDLALRRLESLMAELYGQNIDINYAFEDDPNTATLHNVERDKWDSIESILAYKLMPDFGKGMNPDSILVKQSNAGYSYLCNVSAEVPRTQYPRRMPIGHGTSIRRGSKYRQYFTPQTQAPISSKTVTMYIDDINDFVEHFDSYLVDSEDIASYTIDAETGLTITADSLSSPDINYTIRADGTTETGGDTLLRLKIVITTTAGRKETRIINFQLLDSDIED